MVLSFEYWSGHHLIAYVMQHIFALYLLYNHKFSGSQKYYMSQLPLHRIKDLLLSNILIGFENILHSASSIFGEWQVLKAFANNTVLISSAISFYINV